MVESFTSSKRVGGGDGFIRSCFSHFDRSSVPLRFMYFRHHTWLNFSDDVVGVLRTGFLERKPIIEAWIDGSKFIFDLRRLLQIEYSTGNVRSIAWIDQTCHCFFPGEFCDWIDSDGNPLKRKREDAEAEAGCCCRLSAARNCSIINEETAIFPNTKRLTETERDDYLKDGFAKIAPSIEVTSIHQCNWNKTRLNAFHNQSVTIRDARGNSNMVFAWFGASAKLVERILLHGFELPTKQPPDACGVGVYLSPLQLPLVSANLADADDDGVKHMILCRVILGKVEKVTAGSEQHLPSSVNFDTGSDDPTNPKWYVIWQNIASLHILPESVVSFRHSIHMQDQRRPFSGKQSLDNLMLKLKYSVSPITVLELRTTYRTFKAQQMSRDDFIKKLRQIARKEVIRSAILGMDAVEYFDR